MVLELENLHYPKLHSVDFFFLCEVVQVQAAMCCAISNVFKDFYVLLGICLLSNRNEEMKIRNDSMKRQFFFKLLCVCLWVGRERM